MIVHLALSLLLLLSQSADCQDEDGKCTLAKECITDMKQKDCPSGYVLEPNSIIDNCCPSCTKIGEVPPICIEGVPGYECPFGMICQGDKCATNKTNCYNVVHTVGENKIVYLPNCKADGTWEPVQCKGDSLIGRCFCVDELGRRIFGISWANEAEDMTCACSRRRMELEKSGRTDVTLHCSRNGNYEPLQCDSGLCWCVNKKTGDPTSQTVISDLVSQLPCYDPDTFGSQYLRVCESKAHAIAKMKNILAVHGTTSVTMESVNCDYDGTYGVYQITNGIAFCSWKDGKRLGSWQTVADSSLKSVNCNCARDTKYFEEVGKVMTQICSGNGNYMSNQQINGEEYCVDNDGYPTTPLQESEVPLVCITT